MDWPVVGAVSAVAIVGGVVVIEAITLLRSDTMPAKQPPVLTSYGSSVDRSAHDIPGFANSGTGERPLSFPLIRLIDPDREPEPAPSGAKTAPSQAGKAPISEQPKKPLEPAKAPSVDKEVKVARLSPPEAEAPTTAAPPIRTEQWRVVPTANASYFNLGGHIDRAGIVDSLASPHLRDALTKHSKFAQLPPAIKTHILTQNIDLPKIAPYRNLLGMDDKILEQEQAVKFIRIR